MDFAWTLAERHLITELAVGIARRLTCIRGPREDVGPGYIDHLYMSDFEAGCSVLWRLGVAQAAAFAPDRKRLTVLALAPGQMFPPFFKFLPSPELRKALAGGPTTSAPSVHEMLCAYLGVACDYAEPMLSTRHEPFNPAEEYLREVEALQGCGYIERRGDAVQWTGRIAPAMQELYLWWPDGQSEEAAWEIELAARIAAALDQMPKLTERQLAQEAKRMSEMQFARLVLDQFAGRLDWVPSSIEGRVAEFMWVLKGVYAALKAKDG